MKKSLLSILCLILAIGMLTGCGESSTKEDGKTNSGADAKISCTKTEKDEDGYETTDTIVISSKNGKVTNVEDTNISKMDKDVLDASYQLSTALLEEFNKIPGYHMEYTKVDDETLKYVLTVDYSKLDVKKVKELYGDDSDQMSILKSTDITVDEFKEQNLKDYTCK